MTARYAVIACAAAGSAVAALFVALLIWAPDLGIGLPVGLERAATDQYEARTGEPGVRVARAKIWDDCAVLDLVRADSVVMVLEGDRWHLARISGEPVSEWFDTDEASTREDCAELARG